jgi:hypothetical protein
VSDPRRSLLAAALGFILLERRDLAELRLMRAWLDTWTGVGLVVTGMARQGSLAERRSVAVGYSARADSWSYVTQNVAAPYA